MKLEVDDHARDQPFPFNDIQHAYWIGRQVEIELADVGTHLTLDFEGQLEPERLQRSFDRVLQHHEMLRADILRAGALVIAPPSKRHLIVVVDHRDLGLGEAENAVEQAVSRMRRQAPPLDRWPHFEVELHLLPSGRTRLLLNLDMIIIDAFSVQLLMETWGTLYADPDVELAPLGLGFRDYVLTEQQLDQTEPYQKALAYWQSKLDDMPNAPALPRTAPIAGEKVTRFGHRSADLDADEWRGIKERATRFGVTAPAAVCAAYAEILAYWSKSQSFTLNVTVNRRLPLHADVKKLIGDFTSTLLLHADMASEGSFADKAKGLTQRMWSDMDNVYVGGVRVLRELSRRRGRQIIMPVVFTSALGDLAPATDWAGTLVGLTTETSQVLLDSRVIEYRGGLRLGWDAAEEAFPAGVLDDMFDAYIGFMRKLASDDAAWTTRPSLLPARHARLQQQANATEATVPDGLLHRVADRHLEERPDAPAVITPARTLSYSQLLFRARHLGRKLRDEGAAPNELVAVVMEKGWEQVVAVLAIQEAGAAYLPVDPALPEERIRFLLEYGGVRHVVTQADLEPQLRWPEGISAHVIREGDDESSIDPLPAAQQQTDLAYVIFTSGSTGQPKGVMIDHRGALNTIVDVNRTHDVTERDRVLGLSSLSFDLSVWDIYGMLMAGGALVLPERGASRDPGRWLQLIDEHQVTLWNSVPALLDMLVRTIEHTSEERLRRVRTFLLSGDWIPVSLPARARALSPEARVISMGGATEASIWSIVYPVEDVLPAWQSVPYGKAMANQSFLVLNAHFEPCPLHVPGELYIGGVGLAKGYWRSPEKTDERFVQHPKTKERLYRTGDWGRWLDDGNIEFLGREDDQIKLQGYRIELGEIEAALREHPDVADCYVLIRQHRRAAQKAAELALTRAIGDPQAGRRERQHAFLVSYAVPKPGSRLDEEQLREFLRKKIPSYMVPTRVLLIDEVPLSPNGKVDRRQLPDPDRAPTAGGDAAEAQLSDVQRDLRALWSSLLGVPAERIGLNDNFFDLGGDSLLITTMAARLAEDFQRPVSVTDLFQYVTVNRLAAYVGGEGASDNATATSAQPSPPGTDRLAALRARRQARRSQAPVVDKQTLLVEGAARDAYKEQWRDQRRSWPGQPRFRLHPAEGLFEQEAAVDRRRSVRQFAEERVSRNDLAALLLPLMSAGEGSKKRWRYASAGGLYPVQIFIVANPGHTHDVEGAYAYDPTNHELIELPPAASPLDRRIHLPMNQPIVDAAAASIFLVADVEGVRPIYGDMSRDFCLLEAGMVCQLLDERAPRIGLGLCHLGAFDRAAVARHLSLSRGDEVIHALAVGRAEPS